MSEMEKVVAIIVAVAVFAALGLGGWFWLLAKTDPSAPPESPPLPEVRIPEPPPLPPPPPVSATGMAPLAPPAAMVEPPPTPIPPGERRPTAQGDPRPPNTLWEFYPNRAALLADAQANAFAYAITIDGQMVLSGFGPPDEFVTQPNGTLLSKRYSRTAK